MLSRACLDAGPISLYYQKDPPEKIEELMKKIKDKVFSVYIPTVILVEVFKHLCLAQGKDYATSSVRSFQYMFKPHLISLTPELILDAGELKCQFRAQLSYNDCISIVTARKMKAVLHTTEKSFPTIHNLKIKTYDF